MTSKYGFTKLSIEEFQTWLSNLKLARTVLTVQEHHTFSPDYNQFTGKNHFELQRIMRNHHVVNNGWLDIGQHFSTFPDGTILTGRSMEKSPACITGQNSNAVCIENVGNFDKGKDQMSSAQRETILQMTAMLCAKFNLKADTDSIVYHHWFDLTSGHRNNGTKNNKSCPGTDFFGGNKVADCRANFLPLVQERINDLPQSDGVRDVLKYVCVTAPSLNVRSKPHHSSTKVRGRKPALFGAILRVYKEEDGWYKISGSSEHWVNGKFTNPVSLATVTADKLNVRNGPGVSFSKVGAYTKGQQLFIVKEENGWCKVSMDDKWVSKDFLNFGR